MLFRYVLSAVTAILLVAAITLISSESKGVGEPESTAEVQSNSESQDELRLVDVAKLLARRHKLPVSLSFGGPLGMQKIPGLTASTINAKTLDEACSAVETFINGHLQPYNGMLVISKSADLLEFAVTDDSPRRIDDISTTVELTGSVQSTDGKPLQGILVEINNGLRTLFVTTDDNGQYRVTTKYACHFDLLFSAVDGTTGEMAGKLIPPKYDEQVTKVESVTLVMKPPAVFTVVVVDDDINPVSNATVGVMCCQFGESLCRAGQSDDQGRAQLALPVGVPVRQVFAFAPGKGLDFVSYPASADGGDEETPSSTTHTRLVLQGSRKITMKVRDEQDRPVPGVRFFPWYLQKGSDQGSSLNFTMNQSIGRETTNAEGIVEFDWIPEWSSRSVVFYHDSPEFIARYVHYESKNATDGMINVTLEKHVTLSGRVLDVDGRPAAGATVTGAAMDFSCHDHEVTAIADNDGKYSLRAYPRQVQMIAATSRDGRRMGVLAGVLVPALPLADVDIQLQSTTRVFGRLVTGENATPAKGVAIEITRNGTDMRQFQGVAFFKEVPKEQDDRCAWIGPETKHSVVTDDDGRFEVRLCSGTYDFHSPSLLPKSLTNMPGEQRICIAPSVTEYEISNETELEIQYDFEGGYWRDAGAPSAELENDRDLQFDFEPKLR